MDALTFATKSPSSFQVLRDPQSQAFCLAMFPQLCTQGKIYLQGTTQ